jgi:PGF-CTERM protein
MFNGVFDVYPSPDNSRVLGTYPVAGNTLFVIGQTSDSAAALKQALDNPSIDDIYSQSQFTVGQPTINIQAVSPRMVGDKFTLAGTTNLAVGDNLLVSIVSSSFTATNKSQSGAFAGYGGNCTVIAGPNPSQNQWSFPVDTGQFKPDEYIITVSSVETSASSSTTFQVNPYVAPTPVPTTVPPTPVVTTVQPTPIMTTVNTTVPTTEPTKAPGFGSLVAVAGLGAVAFLVTRK